MADPNDARSVSENRPIRQRYKIAFYAGAWVAALWATNPDGGLWALAWMFPLGLAGFINLRWGNDGGWGIFAACIAIYLVHAFFYFRSRNMRWTLLWLGVLVVLLICNISGCRAMIPRH